MQNFICDFFTSVIVNKIMKIYVQDPSILETEPTMIFFNRQNLLVFSEINKNLNNNQPRRIMFGQNFAGNED